MDRRRSGVLEAPAATPNLRIRAKTKLQSGKDSVVPSRQRVVRAEAEPPQLFRRGADPRWVVPPVEVSGDSQAGLGLGGADEFENLLVAVQGFPGPVLRDLGEEAVFDGIPFGGARGIVRDRDAEVEAGRELGVEFGLPGGTAIAVAPAGVRQDEELTRRGIVHAAF